ncbi:MAG TPA: hypothetical protein VGQ57_15330, partial [Polyangiaceae bacterium]|nr:hypothetical protein [Polyangiaceae bacterium]
RVWFTAAALTSACALPKVDIDPSLGTGGGGNVASGGSGAHGGGDNRGGTDSGALGGGAGASEADARELACGDYCATYLKNCKDSPANTYDDDTDCVTTCFSSNWPFGTDLAEVNSVQCRGLHAQLAAAMPVPHCFHSAEFPTGTSCAPQ